MYLELGCALKLLANIYGINKVRLADNTRVLF